MEYKPVDLKSKKLREFIEELDEYQNSLYPPEFNRLDTIKTLSKENVYFLGAYMDSELCGFCAVKIFPGYGELKRLFISSKHRGKGIAKELISRLEGYIVNQDIYVLKAETGILQKEAINLYESLGYQQNDSFGDYSANPYSIFFSKELTS